MYILRPNTILFVLFLNLLSIQAIYAQEPQLFLPREYAYGILSADLSRDGKYVVTTAEYSTARVWDALTGNLLATVNDSGHFFCSAAFSPDGRFFVACKSNDETAEIYETATCKPVRILKGHTRFLTSVAYSPDGRFVLTGSKDNNARIWDAATGALIHRLRGHSNAVNAVAYSQDGKYVATASADHTAKTWNAKTGVLVHTFTGHTDELFSVAFSPDGKRIATSAGEDNEYPREHADQTARVWDAESGAVLHVLSGNGRCVKTASWSADGRHILTCTGDKTAKIWDDLTGDTIKTLMVKDDWLESGSYSRDGRFIITANHCGSVRIWDATTCQLLRTIGGHVSHFLHHISWSPDGKKIIIPCGDATAKIWETNTTAPLQRLCGHTQWLSRAVYSPESKYIITSSCDNTSKIWDAATGKVLRTLATGIAGLLSFSPDSRYVMTATDYGPAQLWSVATGKIVHTYKNKKVKPCEPAISPDWKKMVTIDRANAGPSLYTWDVASGSLIHQFPLPKEEGYNLNTAFFSHDGCSIISGGNHMMRWDTATGKITRLDLPFSRAEPSPNGRYFATTNWNTETLWDTTGKELHTLTGHSHEIVAIAFSPDEKHLATVANENEVKIWDTAGNNLLTLVLLDSNDYFIYDKDMHYDGTENGRKYMHLKCGTELIGLDQLEKQLYVPDLAKKVMNGEPVTAGTLNELNLCGLLPLVEDISRAKSGSYDFRITPRRGGLGETVLYINNAPALHYQPAHLKKIDGAWILHITDKELRPQFKSGKENIITVRSYTENNEIICRGVSVLPIPAAVREF